MPVYSVKVRGVEGTRVVKASSAAKARDHVVEAEAMSAEELVDAITGGATIETANEAKGEPEPEPTTAAANPKAK